MTPGTQPGAAPHRDDPPPVGPSSYPEALTAPRPSIQRTISSVSAAKPGQGHAARESPSLDLDGANGAPSTATVREGGGRGGGDGAPAAVSELATQLYTISYLVLFSILGTLARLGLQSLTFYPGAPVAFSSVWPNLAGSLIMGFLVEDRKLFRSEWGTPTYALQLQREARQAVPDDDDVENGGRRPARRPDLAAAKKAHLATKKTIPLYIGLATGFCGSFTSFSSFIRDLFLALSNDLPSPAVGSTPRPGSGAYSCMAALAVLVTTLSLSLSGLILGQQLARALEPATPSLPYPFTRNVLDRVCVPLAWGCWLGAVILCALPPPDRPTNTITHQDVMVWRRGRLAFSLALAPLGCVTRYYASAQNALRPSFPLGTFAVNVLGTAVLGMAWDVAHLPRGGLVGCRLLQGVQDGFCGCLTTVSTWVMELTTLSRRHAYIYGSTSVLAALAAMVAIMGGLRWSHGFAALVCVN